MPDTVVIEPPRLPNISSFLPRCHGGRSSMGESSMACFASHGSALEDSVNIADELLASCDPASCGWSTSAIPDIHRLLPVRGPLPVGPTSGPRTPPTPNTTGVAELLTKMNFRVDKDGFFIPSPLISGSCDDGSSGVANNVFSFDIGNMGSCSSAVNGSYAQHTSNNHLYANQFTSIPRAPPPSPSTPSMSSLPYHINQSAYEIPPPTSNNGPTEICPITDALMFDIEQFVDGGDVMTTPSVTADAALSPHNYCRLGAEPVMRRRGRPVQSLDIPTTATPPDCLFDEDEDVKPVIEMLERQFGIHPLESPRQISIPPRTSGCVGGFVVPAVSPPVGDIEILLPPTKRMRGQQLLLNNVKLEPTSAVADPPSSTPGTWSPRPSGKTTIRKRNRAASALSSLQCPVCDRTFTSGFSLRQHSNTHTGARPYVCDKCDKTFAQKTTLRTHRRLHTGERPYACRHCEKAFSDYSTWTKHERTHTGARPYVCTGCSAGFTQSGNLNRHLKTCALAKQLAHC